VDVTVGPTKIDGSPWDGTGSSISSSDVALIAEALEATNPYSTVIGLLSDPAMSAMSKPEVFGTATLTSSAGKAPLQKFAGERDSLRPHFPSAPHWERVPLNSATRIEVALMDEDVLNNDSIGTFVVNSKALTDAVREDKVYQYKVADQTAKAVLFVGLIATGTN
jgi:hypothetical protein